MVNLPTPSKALDATSGFTFLKAPTAGNPKSATSGFTFSSLTAPSAGTERMATSGFTFLKAPTAGHPKSATSGFTFSSLTAPTAGNQKSATSGFTFQKALTDRGDGITEMSIDSGKDSLTAGGGSDCLTAGGGSDCLTAGGGKDNPSDFDTPTRSKPQVDALTGIKSSDILLAADSGDAASSGFDPQNNIFEQAFNPIELRDPALLDSYRPEIKTVLGAAGLVGNNAVDTEMFFTDASGSSDRFAIIQDRTNVNIARDFMLV